MCLISYGYITFFYILLVNIILHIFTRYMYFRVNCVKDTYIHYTFFYSLFTCLYHYYKQRIQNRDDSLLATKTKTTRIGKYQEKKNNKMLFVDISLFIKNFSFTLPCLSRIFSIVK